MTAIRAAFKAYRMHQVLIMPRFARLTIALGLATAVFPVDAEYYFNPRFLSNDLAESVDLSAFTKGREAPPGTYRVDIYLNDEFMTSRDITFIADDNNAELIPCLSTDLLVSLGIKKSALLDNKEHSAEKHVPDNSACTPLQDRLADASTEFDVGQQHLSLSVPQIYVGRMARGYVSPDLWEEGINAGLLNYSFNGNSINNRSNHNAGKSNYAYLNLQSGINIGSWRLRDNSTWSYNSGSSNSSDSNKWQHINTSAERDIIPLRSRLTVGDSYTDGDIFDSVNFRGLKINSTEAMLPDSQHGFAPVIHGIARGTAQVSVKQNGYDVYQTTVPPGPFTIDDINSATNGGDLQVTIKEADGSIQTLYVPYSSVPVLQRAGYTRYALAMGEYRSGNNLQSSPKFIQGAAGGWGAVKSVANAVRKQMDIRQDVIAMFDMNKPEGFDCPGCAWPDPKHSASFDICENGAKAIAWEVTDKQVNASFFAENTVQSLLTWGDHELEAAGRLTQPLKYDAVSDCYKPLSWQQAFDEIGARLQSYSDPNQVEFYTSGRTSNEAAFLYQLFAREYGSNNFPDCSNMCHEPTSVGLAASIGVGKGTVLLEDFEKCDLVICIGHNPGTNHPRMLTSLRALVKRGAKMIAINPLQERGLERFTAPQNPFEMLTNSETQLDSAYYNVRIGGDMALLKGMMRLLIERDDAASAAGRPSLLDDEFIQTHTVGFDELRRDVLNSEWKDIERISGLSQTQIAELADAYAAAERTIICYGMGITQHEHGTQNVQQLVNLLLMKGNIGKPGAGICPLRGHSNVQGDRTVGITEKPSAEFLARLGERYGFTPPHAPGHAAIASMQAICTGQARALICMGGNFALAMPDREASAVPLTQLDLAVHVATKLNRSHLLTARHSYILPVLGRSEIDMQKNGAQAVTVEDSMSMIHASRGMLKPAGVMLKSECAVVAGIAQAALPQSVVAWEYLVEDYDRIRNDIEAVLPEFADYNQRIRHPGGFHLINAAAERRWMTPSGKANFITSKGLLEDPSSAFNSKLVMATVRSHDQYNTTIYGMDDRYRGVFGQRDVVFMSAKQAKICRVKNGERVNLIALTPDGKRSSRRMDRLKVVIYPMADRSLVTYFPESNHMLTLDNHDPLSGIPGYKSIPVELEPSN
ncbi:TPA: acid resistance putative oxidoreductase YdeP [Escherichia coli]|nr:acid resistance putative oxidoreductase YdeP [Escherichia coli]HCO8271283.1 acid resistance putative oxidoreductase YdeP [Escherichia coli]